MQATCLSHTICKLVSRQTKSFNILLVIDTQRGRQRCDTRVMSAVDQDLQRIFLSVLDLVLHSSQKISEEFAKA